MQLNKKLGDLPVHQYLAFCTTRQCTLSKMDMKSPLLLLCWAKCLMEQTGNLQPAHYKGQIVTCLHNWCSKRTFISELCNQIWLNRQQCTKAWFLSKDKNRVRGKRDKNDRLFNDNDSPSLSNLLPTHSRFHFHLAHPTIHLEVKKWCI